VTGNDGQTANGHEWTRTDGTPSLSPRGFCLIFDA
jgi:hypothetical protein